MDPYTEEGRRDLMTQVEHSRWKQDPVRESRRKLLKRAAGSEWYPSGADEDTPVNQMEQAEGALVQHLIGGDPRALVVASSPELDPTAEDQRLALAKVSQQIGLRKKLQRLVRDAIYGIGIARIGMTHDKYVPIREIAPELDEEGEIGVGKLLFEVISLEHWVHDCQSDTLEEREFCGHAYWVDEEDIEHYLPGVDETDLLEEEKRWIDEHGNETAGAISRGTEGEGQHSHGKKYWLWDLWLPFQNTLVTTQVNGTGEIAHVREWNSRPGGPYLFLSYREFPDQAMPKSVLADLALVHDSMNSTFRKLIEQTRDAKTVLGFRPGYEDDAQRIIDARSRAAIQMRDPSAVQEFSFNGPDQALLGMFLQSREIGSMLGGNTDVLGGLGAQAPTYGQEQMVAAQAGGKVNGMEQDTADFVVEAFEAMRWYLYHEQMTPIPIEKEVEGIGLKIPSEFSALKAEEAPGSFDAFALAIEPYTLKYQSPEERIGAIIMWWQNVIIPAMQTGVLQQAPDMGKLIELIARYANLPELKQILRVVTAEEMAMAGGGGSGPRQSPVTTRHQVRHSAPGMSRQGQAMQAMQMMGAQQ